MQQDTTFDVIVIGLGAMGSAATYQLAKSGARVLGVDQYSPPHGLGSSHGDSRFTRLATGEGAEYAPLAIRSHQLWRDIELETGCKLFTECGGLIMAAEDSVDPLHNEDDFIAQTLAVADAYGIKHEHLSTSQISRQFPQFALTGTEEGYFEPEAGFVRPELCVRSQLELAKKHGAVLHMNELVLSYKSHDGAVTVVTDQSTYTARRLLLCAGPWINELFDEPELFKVYRQVLYWFELKDITAYLGYKSMPVYAWAFPDGFFYGFPPIDGQGGGIKVATEEYVTTTNPSELERTVSKQEVERMRDLIKDRLPGVGQKCLQATACMYTVTPDHKFIIDFHPRDENIIVASPCSGHGFKHSAAIGEILSQLALSGKSDIDVKQFSFGRLLGT